MALNSFFVETISQFACQEDHDFSAQHLAVVQC